MTEVLTQVIHNCETGEVTIVPLTAEELAEREVLLEKFLQEKAAVEAAEAAKAEAKAAAEAKLLALGLTLEEALAITE